MTLHDALRFTFVACVISCGPLYAQSHPLSGAASTAAAEPIRLRNHEPTFIGWTRDSDDVKEGFLDVTLSMQYPLFADRLSGGNNRLHLLPYFAGTVRFSQYIGSRDSSPVVLKRFNPKLFVRYGFSPYPPDGDSPDAYIDLEYAHESNGQSVVDSSSFQATSQAVGGDDYARDYISRGWDYWGLTAKHTFDGGTRLYVSRRWYCGCWLQKNIEEFYPFEGQRDIRSIEQVSGWRAIVKLARNDLVDNAYLILDTGTKDTFKYSTGRIEIGFKPVSDFLGVPLIFWAQTGYLSDLAQYYRKVDSIGVAFLLKTFQE